MNVNLKTLSDKQKDTLIKFLLANTCASSYEKNVYTAWLESTNLLKMSKLSEEENDFVYSFIKANKE